MRAVSFGGAFYLTFRLKMGHLNEQSLYLWEKGVANQTVIPAQHVPVKTGSGNPEAPGDSAIPAPLILSSRPLTSSFSRKRES